MFEKTSTAPIQALDLDSLLKLHALKEFIYSAKLDTFEILDVGCFSYGTSKQKVYLDYHGLAYFDGTSIVSNIAMHANE